MSSKGEKAGLGEFIIINEKLDVNINTLAKCLDTAMMCDMEEPVIDLKTDINKMTW